MENPIVFIGPPGSAMRSLGDKILSTIVAQHAQVPCMALSGTGISDTVMSPQGFVTVPDDAYAKASVNSSGRFISERVEYNTGGLRSFQAILAFIIFY
jgi:acetyl-CoA carboxylase/biotin carboxylase 1